MTDLTHYTTPGLVEAPEIMDLPSKPLSDRERKATTIPADFTAVDTPTDPNMGGSSWEGLAEEPTFRNVMDAAFRQSNLMAHAADILVRPTFDPVKGYDVNRDETATEGIPNDLQDNIRMSTSPDEAQYWKQQAQETMKDRATLETVGAYGTAATITAVLVDPISIVGGLGTVKAASVATRLAGGAKKVGRATGMVTGTVEGYAYGEISREAGKMDAEGQLIGMIAGGAAGILVGQLAPTVLRTARGTDEILDSAVTSSRTYDEAAQAQADELAATPAPETVHSVKTDIPPIHPSVEAENMLLEAEILADTDAVVAGFQRMGKNELAKLRRRAAKDPASKKDLDNYIAAREAAKVAEKDARAAAKGARVLPAPEPRSGGAAGVAGRGQFTATKDDMLTPVTEQTVDIQTEINEFTATIGNGLKAQLGNMLKLNQSKWMTSQARRFLTGENDAARWFAYNFLENGSGSVNNRTAAMLKHTLNSKLDRHIRGVYDGLKEHTKLASRSDKTVDRIKKNFAGDYKADFDIALRSELEKARSASDLGTPHVSTAPQYIQDAAAAWQKMADEAADILGHYGLVDSAQALKMKRGYVPLKWNTQKIHKLATDPARMKRAVDLLARSYVKMGIPAKEAAQISKRVFERALTPVSQIDANLEGLFDASATGQLRSLMSEAGIDQGKIGNLLARIDSRFQQQGSASFTKYRTSVDLNMADGDISLLGLVDNDMTTLFRQYTGELSGRAALASKGIRSQADWAATVAAVLDNEARLGKETSALAEELDGLHDAFMSRPRNNGINRNAQRLMEVTRISMLGKNGFSQLHEMGNLIGRFGTAATLRAVPMAFKAMKDARAGQQTQLMDDLEALLGNTWSDHLIHRPDVRLDRAITTDTAFMQGVDNALAKGQHYMGYISGMHHITELQRRMAVTMEAGQLAKYARDGIPDGMQKRMEAMGFEFHPQGNWDTIKKALNDHAVFNSRGHLEELNTANWAPSTSDDFANILQRSAGQLIQKNFIGETPSVLHSTTGALITQFRAFPLVAKEKQLQRNLMIRDAESFYAFMGALAVGTIIAPLRMAAEGNSERISVESVAASALSYLPMMTIFPDVVGVGTAAGILPDWAYHRNWDADKITHPSIWDVATPPSVMYLARAGKALAAGSQELSPWKLTPWGGEEYDSSAADVRAYQGTILGNNIVVSYLFNELIIPAVE